MKNDLLKTYTRTSPSVLAVQVGDAIADNWVAVDAQGGELSRASTIDSVKQAAPDAERYAPIVDLPGLEGKPLNEGDYLINDGDGVFYTMDAETFEDLFVEGGDAPKAKKGESLKLDYDGKHLSPAELLQELKARDDELKAAETERDEAKDQNEKLAQQAKDEKTEALANTSSEASPNGQRLDVSGKILNAPDYVVVIDTTGLDDEGSKAKLQEQLKLSHENGSTFHRVTTSEDGTRALLEGWNEQPEDQGQPAWPAEYNPSSSANAPADDRANAQTQHAEGPIAAEGGLTGNKPTGEDEKVAEEAKAEQNQKAADGTTIAAAPSMDGSGPNGGAEQTTATENGKKGGAKKPATKKPAAKAN